MLCQKISFHVGIVVIVTEGVIICVSEVIHTYKIRSYLLLSIGMIHDVYGYHKSSSGMHAHRVMNGACICSMLITWTLH